MVIVKSREETNRRTELFLLLTSSLYFFSQLLLQVPKIMLQSYKEQKNLISVGHLSSTMSRREENHDRQSVPSAWKLNPVVITASAEVVGRTEFEL